MVKVSIWEEVGGFFDNLGKGAENIAKEVGGTVGTIWRDVVGVSKEIIHVPQNLLHEGSGIIKSSGDSVSNVIKTTTTGGSQVIKSAGESILMSTPVLLAAAGVAALVLLKK